MLAPIDIDPRTFLRQHCTLPALPESIGRIQKMIQDDNVAIEKIAGTIGSDPSMLAQVLKVVNSAYYALPREVWDPRIAIAFLGLNEVYRMVLSLSVVKALAVEEKDELNAFWSHSLYAAICTKHLAKKQGPQVDVEELWSAAILHDIGKIVYLKMFPEHYRALRVFCREHGCLFSEAERLLSLPASAYLGVLLCDHWRLPDSVREACEAHTLRDLLTGGTKGPITDLQRRICLGNLLAVLSADDLNDLVRKDIAGAVRTALSQTEAEFLAMMGDIYELKSEVEELLTPFRSAG